LGFDDQSAILPPGVHRWQTRHDSDVHPQTNLKVRTSSGLVLNLLTDRALDIGSAFYKGTPIAWTSEEGFRHPSDLSENIWNKRFAGGLVATCGLENVGPPCVDEGVPYPQHGRIGGEPAERIRSRIREIHGRRFLTFSAIVRQPESQLQLQRAIIICDDIPLLRLVDTVVNQGLRAEPVMIQYHCNFGRPIVTPGGIVEIPEAHTTPRDADAALKLDSWQTIDAPRPNEPERVFRHQQPMPDWAQACVASLPSEAAGSEWTIFVRYGRHTLPWIWQWCLFSADAYVLGLEPANCDVKPRSDARLQNALPTLEPEDQVTFRIEIGLSGGVDTEL
jgi:hypothetical protein